MFGVAWIRFRETPGLLVFTMSTTVLPNVFIMESYAADDASMTAPNVVKFICRSVLQRNIARKPDMICQMDVSVTEALRHKTAFRIVVLSGIHMQMADVR